jgi:tetratricopeptide (TPR) repeat protein
MTNQQELLSLFQSLVALQESDILDFKSNAYNLSEESRKLELVKDIMCMYNTPREGNAHIVLGVKEYKTRPHELCGIAPDTNAQHLDQSDLQRLFLEKFRVEPCPEFRIDILKHDEKDFGIITIPMKKVGPCKVANGDGEKLKSGSHIYFRRGASNDMTRTPEETYSIMQWFQNDRTQSIFPQQQSGWDQFLEASSIDSTYGFDSSRKYILVASPLKDKITENLPSLGEIPAALVLDFDFQIDISGLLYEVQGRLKRSLHTVVKRERPTINPQGTTYWFFVRGLDGREGTLEIGDYKAWKKHYKGEIGEQLRNFAKVVNPVPVTCIVLWYQDPHLAHHLQSILSSIEEAFENAVEFVIVTSYPGELQGIQNEVDAEIINISIHELCSGLDVLISTGEGSEANEYLLPSSSNAPIRLNSDDRKWLEEELEIVHLNTGVTAPELHELVGRRFLCGAEITWHELSLHCDVVRDKTEKVKSQVEIELSRRRAWRVNLYHEAGAGGTTVARRILWELHNKFPCLILRRSKPLETSERLFRLATLTGQPILLLVDSSQIPERQVDELYNYIRSRQLSVVILHVQRRLNQQTEKERVIYLEALLSNKECWQFVEKFSQFEPAKRSDLERLVSNNSQSKSRTAFYFGLQTFGREFLGLERYIGHRLENLSSEQKSILLFLSISHHYAQYSVRSQAFAEFLGIPPNRTVNLREAFSSCEEALDLLIEVEGKSWRTTHNLIAQEILEQELTNPGSDRRTWKQNLSNLARSFAEFCRGNSLVPSEEMLELVRRTFIYRNNLDVLGTERVAAPALQSSSQLLQDIPSPEGRLEILRQLTKLYAEEAHFWAHLGRFYASQSKDYIRALACIEQGISLTNAKDPVLHHMKGMAIRNQIDNLVAEKSEIQTVVDSAKVSSSSFEDARNLSPDDEHGYISEVQLLVKVLDYAGTKHVNGIISYLATPGIDPFLLDSFERAEDLLEQVRRNREGQGEPSSFEADCRARLDTLYGRHDRALQTWDSLLSRKDNYHPPLRRQIIWTHLARHNYFWNKIPTRDLQRIASLLEENLQEEPSNDKDLRLWIQAVRWLKHSPTIESVIERVSYWKANSGTLDPVYYLYVLYVLSALQGSAQAKDYSERYMEECRQMARFRRNRTNSFEWLGSGSGINSLVHHSELGQWKTDVEFWERTEKLIRVRGRVNRVNAPQQGYIELKGGLLAFYVPARSNHSKGRSENQPVDFYLGFSYDGLRAWEVKDIGKDTQM